ncbi:unnamed protein product, partial [Rotaria socialis]
LRFNSGGHGTPSAGSSANGSFGRFAT